jgi:hypothetical protein
MTTNLVVYITFEKHTFRGSYINTRDESHFEFEIRPSVQHLFMHSKPTIQYIIVAWIIAVMIVLKYNILVADRDELYQMKTYTISSTWGVISSTYSAQSRTSSIRMFSYRYIEGWCQKVLSINIGITVLICAGLSSQIYAVLQIV